MEIQAVPVSKITVDPSLQPRVGGLDAGHVKELQEAPESWPPLVVVKQSSGYLLVDGAHRLAAAQNLELETVPVKVIEPPIDGDLKALAFSLNASHGRPLSLSDRREFARYLLQEYTALSDSEIGRRSGLAQQTIKAIRIELEEVSQIERVTTRLGGDGKLYPSTPTNTKRQEGELPAQGVLEMAGDALAGVLCSADRVRQRKITQFYRRLTVALGDIDNLPDDGTPEEDAEACRLVLGQERANELGNELGRTSSYVLLVAEALGYKDE